MKQGMLPLIPRGASQIDGLFSVARVDTQVVWFQGCLPFRVHPEDDHRTQRATIAFLHEHGNVTQACLSRSLGLHENTVLACVKLYRQKGDAGFYEPTRSRSVAVMREAVMAESRRLLLEGRSRAEVAAAVGVRKCNIDKAIQQGRLPKSVPHARRAGNGATTRSERVAADRDEGERGQGVGCTRLVDRIMAMRGDLAGAETEFSPCLDIENGGVLCALPGLVANGLFVQLSRLRSFDVGFYRMTHVFLLLAFMALLRIKTVEALRRNTPGEFGKLLGLDRIPEVRCLREKLCELAADAKATTDWAQTLAREWMQADPELAGTLYIDGHVRVYHGSRTSLPRRYVARLRLCMSGVTDYWVNDRDGQPFFYIERPVDDGMLAVLRTEIIPRLLKDVPGQPSEAELTRNPRLCRFRIVIDRAGSSPRFIREMWMTHRIAVLTYRKDPGPDWPESEFRTINVTLANGETVDMQLAEHGIQLNTEDGLIECREIRRLQHGTHGNHQTSILSTDYLCPTEKTAPAMFARWNQENFFRYMLEEFGLDLLAEHRTEVFPCSIPVLNPEWKKHDAQCRALRGKIAVAKVALTNWELKLEDMQPRRMHAWIVEKDKRRTDLTDLQQKLDGERTLRRQRDKHVPLDQLPPECQFERLAPTRKLLLDTVRMIAYRTETAMVAITRPNISHPETEEGRAVIKALLASAADLHPDHERRELRVVIHPLAEMRMNKNIDTLLATLNDSDCVYPGTDLRMVYELLPPPAQPSG